MNEDDRARALRIGRMVERRTLGLPPSSRLTVEVETDRNGHVRPKARVAVHTGEDLEAPE